MGWSMLDDAPSAELASDTQETFANIEQDYMQTLNELCQDPQMTPYLESYTAMFDAAFAEHVRTTQMAQEHTQLEKEIATVEQRVTKALCVIDANEFTRASLEQQVRGTHEQLDAALAREQLAMEIIDNMKHTLRSLHAEIEFRTRMEATTADEENPTVAKHRQGLERELEKLVTEVTNLSDKVTIAVDEQTHLEGKSDHADVHIAELTYKLDEASAVLMRSQRVRDRLKSNLAGLTEAIDDMDAELDDVGATVESGAAMANRLAAASRAQAEADDRCHDDMHTLRMRINELQDECDQQRYALLTLRSEYDKAQQRLRARNRELGKLRSAAANEDAGREHGFTKERRMHEDALRLGRQRTKMRGKLAGLERVATAQKTALDVTRREIVGRVHERDMIRFLLKRELSAAEENAAAMRLCKTELNKQEKTIVGHMECQQENRDYMMFLRHERDQLRVELGEKASQLEELVYDARQRQREVYATRHLQFENLNRMRRQQGAYDGMLMEMLAIGKMLDEQRAISQELRDVVGEFNVHNERSREIFERKEQEVMQCQQTNAAIIAETVAMRADLEANQEDIHAMRTTIAQHKLITKELLQQIEANDFKMKADDKVISTVMNETEMLGAQLVARNEELMQLGRVSDILHQMLAYGEGKYRQRLEDIRVLKKEISCFAQIRSVHTKEIANMNDYKAEALKLDKDLIRVRIKNTCICQEMSKPLNIHPWSKMEGSDPEKFQLMRRILFMQRRCLINAKYFQARDIQLKELTTLYQALTQMLARQPGKDFGKRKQMMANNLKEGQESTDHLARSLKLTEQENANVRRQLQDMQVALRTERQTLLQEKDQHRKTIAKRQKIDQRLQAKLDQMAKFMSQKKIMEIVAGLRNYSVADRNLVAGD